jgi:hypothetical protein
MFYFLRFYFGYNNIHIAFRNRHMGDVVLIIILANFDHCEYFLEALP